jgi:PPK2 family polyphosphate:nucleotide phosphotransferase
VKLRAADYRVKPGREVDLADWPTRLGGGDTDEEEMRRLMADHLRQMENVQQRLYASDTHAMLVVLQGMDAAGKDGVIRHVMSGIDPQGCQVASFKAPSVEELRHDFLWRAVRALPPRGMIGIFNRSYYEEVLVVRVHREMLEAEQVADGSAKSLWKDRYKSIRQFEAHLERSQTAVVKIFLHLSWEEQRKRFLARIDEPDKNWKLSVSDIKERDYWDRYQHAYAKAIEATSTKACPWYIVPADHKPTERLIVSKILVEALEALKVDFPKSSAAHRRELLAVRRKLTD